MKKRKKFNLLYQMHGTLRAASPSILSVFSRKIEGDAARRVNAWLVNRMTGKSNEVACNIVHIGKQKSKN